MHAARLSDMEYLRSAWGVTMARPQTNFTDEEITQLEKLSAVLTVAQMADFFGISERGFRLRMKRDARVRAAYKRGKSDAIFRVGGKLLQMAEGGNVTAMIFFLKTQAGWRETEAVPDVSEISKLSDGELEKRREKVGLAS
jgi:hypothetical protein